MAYCCGSDHAASSRKSYLRICIGSRGGGTYFRLGGQASGVAYARSRRQCIEARSVDQSVRSAEKNFRLHFSVIRLQDGLSWHLRALYCAFQMYEDRCCARSATRFAYITRLAESAASTKYRAAVGCLIVAS